jgi:signal transduction histidine kinase
MRASLFLAVSKFRVANGNRHVHGDTLAYEELTRQSSELARLNEEKNRFLGMAAHDLRSPLTVIVGYAGLLAKEESADPEKLLMYEEIASAGRFMLDLINDLLDVSRIEARKHDINVSSFDAVDVLRQKINAYLPFAKAKNIEIDITGDATIAMASDADKLRQIIGNLAGNAIKYSNPAGTIEIAIRQHAEALHLDVKDQGIGIAADQLDRIFEPFVRLVESGTAGERSTGLGLWIVAKIVAAIGGTIRVESEVGVGSTFRVVVPLSMQRTG